MKSNRLPQHGITLVELMVVIAITAILATLAVPAFTTTISNTRSTNAVNTFRAALETARSEAIRQGRNVMACRSLNPLDALPACTGAAGGNFAANDWASGWVVFADNDGNGTPSAGEVISQVQNPLGPGDGARPFILGNLAVVTYSPTGVRDGAAGVIGAFNVGYGSVANPARTSPRCLFVEIVGQVRTVNGECP